MKIKTSDPASVLWQATAPPPPATPALEGEREADVCVVGGGFTGLSTALHLAEAGARVVVLEAEDPGFGASGRNHGQVVPMLSRYGPEETVARFGPEEGERFNRFTAEAAKLVFELIDRLGIDCDARPVGWLLPVDSPARDGTVRARAEAWARRGMPVRYLERDETEAMTGSRHWQGALHHAWGGNIQPLAFARGLAKAAIDAGAAVHARSPATALARSGGRWRIETPGGAVTADQAVLATNGYTGGLWPGLKRAVVPFRLFLAATAPQGGNVRRHILPGDVSVSDSRTLLWPFRWDREGRMVMGGDIVLPWRARGRAETVARRRLQAAFPELGDAEFEFVWDGKVAMTVDRLPRAMELGPGVWTALGYNGRGVALATAMGRLLAGRCLEGLKADDPVPAALRRPHPVPSNGLAVPIARAMLLRFRRQDAKAARSRPA